MRTEEEGVPETLPGSGAEWIVFVHSARMTLEAQRALQEWRAAAAKNEIDFRKAESVWKLTGELADDPVIRAELDELRRKAQAREARARRWMSSWRGRLAAAAAIVLAIATGTLLVSSRSTEWHEAARGELSVIELPDGSNIAVNTDSRVAVRYSATRRDLTLEKGEALFEVAADSKRPFTVHARNGEVRALGTRFNVIAENGLVTVTLLHGRAEVVTRGAAGEQHRLLGEKESVAYGADGVFVSADPITGSVDRIEGYRNREWNFEGLTLERAVREHNRYTTKPLRLSEADWGQKTFGGRFKMDDPEAFVAAVEYVTRGRVIDQGESLLLVPE